VPSGNLELSADRLAISNVPSWFKPLQAGQEFAPPTGGARPAGGPGGASGGGREGESDRFSPLASPTSDGGISATATGGLGGSGGGSVADDFAGMSHTTSSQALIHFDTTSDREGRERDTRVSAEGTDMEYSEDEFFDVEYTDHHFADFGDERDAEGEPLLEHDDPLRPQDPRLRDPYLNYDPHDPFYPRYLDERDPNGSNNPWAERGRLRVRTNRTSSMPATAGTDYGPYDCDDPLSGEQALSDGGGSTSGGSIAGDGGYDRRRNHRSRRRRRRDPRNQYPKHGLASHSEVNTSLRLLKEALFVGIEFLNWRMRSLSIRSLRPYFTPAPPMIWRRLLTSLIPMHFKSGSGSASPHAVGTRSSHSSYNPAQSTHLGRDVVATDSFDPHGVAARPDLYVPLMLVLTMAQVLLWSIDVTGTTHSHCRRETLLGTSIAMSVGSWAGTAVWYYLVSYVLGSRLRFVQALAVSGYGLFGWVLALIAGQLMLLARQNDLGLGKGPGHSRLLSKFILIHPTEYSNLKCCFMN